MRCLARVKGEPVGLERPDRPVGVDLNERSRGRRLHQSQTDQRERRPERERNEPHRAAASLSHLDADDVRRAQQERLEERDEQPDRHEQDADADEQPPPPDVHLPGGRERLAPGAPTGQVDRRGRPPGRPGEQEDGEEDEPAEHEGEGSGVRHELHERSRAARDRSAEEPGRPRPEEGAAGHGVASAPPVLRPGDRVRPLLLEVRAFRPVEERRPELTPPSLERDPRIPRACGGRGTGDGHHRRPHVDGRPPRVVAADALRRGAAEIQRLPVEVRVRAVGRVDDRVCADALELRVVPGGPLGTLVLAVADLDRRMVERLLRRRRVEDDLDHLPVALVQVVPLVEDVEEPVLERELARMRGVGHDVCVGRGVPLGTEVLLPVQVVAAGLERVAGEVEVVAPEPAAEIRGARCNLDEVVPPGSAQRNRRLAEDGVDVDRHIVQPRATVFAADDEAHDGRVPVRQLALLRQCTWGARGGCTRDEGRVADRGESGGGGRGSDSDQRLLHVRGRFRVGTDGHARLLAPRHSNERLPWPPAERYCRTVFTFPTCGGRTVDLMRDRGRLKA